MRITVKIFKIEKDKETLKKKIFELLEKLGLEKSILERYPALPKRCG